MFFEILTLFPEMFKGPFNESIIARAREKDLIDINISDIRDFTDDKHNTTDDYPYGGGAGMVLKIDPIDKALKYVKGKREGTFPVILLTPQGERLNQDIIKNFSQKEGLILLCGHYEGVDERIRKNLISKEISIGDFVLTGGELPAMILVDAVARMIPGVLGDANSKIEDSFFNGLLDYPSYTRPREYKGMKVPEILLSGNHQHIARWRKKSALKRTLIRRPELLESKKLTGEEEKLLQEIKAELEGETNGKN